MDQPDHKFLDKLWATLREATAPGQKVFAFSQRQVAEQFTKVALAAGLGCLRPVLYQLRHTGPSMDIATGKRSIEGVRARGRWRSDRSCLRYAKEGRVGEQLQRLPADVRTSALSATSTLTTLLRKRCGDFFVQGAGINVVAKSSSKSSLAVAPFRRR